MRKLYVMIFLLIASCSGARALQIDSVQDTKLLLDGGSVSVSAVTEDGNDINVLFDSSIDTVDREGHPLVRINGQLERPDSKSLDQVMVAFEHWLDKECKDMGSSPVLEDEQLKCKVVFALVEAVRVTYRKKEKRGQVHLSATVNEVNEPDPFFPCSRLSARSPLQKWKRKCGPSQSIPQSLSKSIDRTVGWVGFINPALCHVSPRC